MIKRTSPVLPAPPAHKVRLDRRVILVNVVPLVSLDLPAPQALPVHKVTWVLPVHVALMELSVLSDQWATQVLPDPRVGLAHKARLGRRVTLENVVLRVTQVLPDPRVGLAHKARLGRRVTLENVVLRVTQVLPDPRVGLAHKARLGRRVTLENVVLRVDVVLLALLGLLALVVSVVLLAKVVTSSGTRR